MIKENFSPFNCESTWHSEVRSYEIDFQNIVNNARYFEFLDHARNIHFKKIGIDVANFAKNGINIVLVDTFLKYKYSLKLGDFFFVKSVFRMPNKFKLIFNQNVFLEKSEKLILEAESTVCATNIETGRIVVLQDLFNVDSIIKNKNTKN